MITPDQIFVIKDMPATLHMPDGTIRQTTIPAPKHKQSPHELKFIELDFQEDKRNGDYQRVKRLKKYEVKAFFTLLNEIYDPVPLLVASWIDLSVPTLLGPDASGYKQMEMVLLNKKFSNKPSGNMYVKAQAETIEEANFLGIERIDMEFATRTPLNWDEFEQLKIFLHPMLAPDIDLLFQDNIVQPFGQVVIASTDAESPDPLLAGVDNTITGFTITNSGFAVLTISSITGNPSPGNTVVPENVSFPSSVAQGGEEPINFTINPDTTADGITQNSTELVINNNDPDSGTYSVDLIYDALGMITIADADQITDQDSQALALSSGVYTKDFASRIIFNSSFTDMVKNILEDETSIQFSFDPGLTGNFTETNPAKPLQPPLGSGFGNVSEISTDLTAGFGQDTAIKATVSDDRGRSVSRELATVNVLFPTGFGTVDTPSTQLEQYGVGISNFLDSTSFLNLLDNPSPSWQSTVWDDLTGWEFVGGSSRGSVGTTNTDSFVDNRSAFVDANGTGGFGLATLTNNDLNISVGDKIFFEGYVKHVSGDNMLQISIDVFDSGGSKTLEFGEVFTFGDGWTLIQSNVDIPSNSVDYRFMFRNSGSSAVKFLIDKVKIVANP